MKQRGCSYFRLKLEREYKVCNLGLKERSRGRSNEGERSTGLSSEGRDPLVTQADLSAPRVCSPAVAQLHNKVSRHRRKICANSLRLYNYYTQSSPSRIKIWIIFSYIYESFVVCPAVQYTTIPQHLFLRLGLVSLFNGISTFVKYLMPNPSL